MRYNQCYWKRALTANWQQRFTDNAVLSDTRDIINSLDTF